MKPASLNYQRNDITMLVPPCFYSKKILDAVNDVYELDAVESFGECDDADKSKLTALGLEAFKYDIEIILSRSTNKFLANYLLTFDPDERIEFVSTVIEEVQEYFAPYFDELFNELKTDYDHAEPY